MALDPFIRKLNQIRYAYGKEAMKYFVEHPYCETCHEERIVVLNVHHTDGKKVNNFKILCHNCHMVLHNPHLADETAAKYIERVKHKEDVKDAKYAKILEMLNNGISIRTIINEANTSMCTIKRILEEHGFITVARQGYYKKDT